MNFWTTFIHLCADFVPFLCMNLNWIRPLCIGKHGNIDLFTGDYSSQIFWITNFHWNPFCTLRIGTTFAFQRLNLRQKGCKNCIKKWQIKVHFQSLFYPNSIHFISDSSESQIFIETHFAHFVNHSTFHLQLKSSQKGARIGRMEFIFGFLEVCHHFALLTDHWSEFSILLLTFFVAKSLWKSRDFVA